MYMMQVKNIHMYYVRGSLLPSPATSHIWAYMPYHILLCDLLVYNTNTMTTPRYSRTAFQSTHRPNSCINLASLCKRNFQLLSHVEYQMVGSQLTVFHHFQIIPDNLPSSLRLPATYVIRKHHTTHPASECHTK